MMTSIDIIEVIMHVATCLKCQKLLSKTGTMYGLHLDCFKAWFEVDAAAEFQNVVRQPTDSEESLESKVKHEYWNSSFFQGKFRKYSASLGQHEYLLKIEQEEAPELPNVEFLCNQIADEIGIAIPKYYLIQFDSLRCFVSRNFIAEQRHAVTLNHIYRFIDSAEQYNCRTLIKVITRQTNEDFHSVEAFIQLCLYDALIGNHDRHGRNLGFLQSARGQKLSPVYDNTSALGLESGPMLKAKFNPKGKIYTQNSQEPTMQDYVSEFMELGYQSSVENFQRRIDIDAINQLIENSFCTDLMKSAFKNLVKARYQELQHALRVE